MHKYTHTQPKCVQIIYFTNIKTKMKRQEREKTEKKIIRRKYQKKWVKQIKEVGHISDHIGFLFISKWLKYKRKIKTKKE